MQTYVNLESELFGVCFPCLMASIVKAHCKEEGNNLLSMLVVARMRTSGFKVQQDLHCM